MNLNLFKTFVKVVETQNLSRTADELGLSQPAVTKQIQALEDIYGVLLLERSGRRLKTTEAGETLYQCARDIIKALEKTEKAMEDVSESRKGALYIGASTIPGQYILPPIIKQFKDRFPNVTISMDIADTDKIFNRVADRELDVGVVGAWINNRKVDGFAWLEDELVVVVPQDHRLATKDYVNVKDLLSEKWIVREKGSGTRRAIEDFLTTQGVKREELNVCLEAGSTEAVLAAVESGMGISIISHWAIKRSENQRSLTSIKLTESGARRFLYVIYPRQKTRRKTVINFLDIIKTIA
ncbi:MAG TPA: selenium metabolism-associated LysR family transcriptional regulator [Syntrophomonadaceae bacterium]|nr:LysR family transcriptional regulator [Syntrophomonadaceae bacterium]HOQ10071.1 selenium metabolism-associated LysR family transcriptional regulator [Syntrophomonadaceae bacterium]HPU49144.1 selenium metabolism-associated LysR family transcriptional regulator [Syntrophomonadaceae bacterium]